MAEGLAALGVLGIVGYGVSWLYVRLYRAAGEEHASGEFEDARSHALWRIGRAGTRYFPVLSAAAFALSCLVVLMD